LLIQALSESLRSVILLCVVCAHIALERFVPQHLANMSSHRTNLLDWQRKHNGYCNELRGILGKEFKAKGTLILRIAESLHHEVDALSTKDTWKMLSSKYSVQGPSLLYATFKQVYSFQGNDPTEHYTG